MDEMVERFDIARVHQAGAKFDFEKCKWFNHQYVQKISNSQLADVTEKILAEKNIKAERAFVEHICGLVKERCTFMNDVWDNAFFFFQRPEKYDVDAVKPKWTEEKRQFFDLLISRFEDLKTIFSAFFLLCLYK